jgi:hypothetical protein
MFQFHDWLLTLLLDHMSYDLLILCIPLVESSNNVRGQSYTIPKFNNHNPRLGEAKWIYSMQYNTGFGY